MSDKVKIYCPDCGGSKRIPTEDPKSFSSYPCPTCRGTGEVESRSVQRREACQKGEAMPTFDKPEILPIGDPDRCSDCGHNLNKPAGEDCNVRHEMPEMPIPYMDERIWAWGEGGNGWACVDKYGETPYLRADKVRELVRAVDVLRNYAWDCMEGRKQTEKFVKLNCPVESLINALFPEGVEK